MNVAQVYLWIGKGALGVAFIIVVFILLREIKNRWTIIDPTDKLNKPHQQLKLFSIFYLITMVLLSGANILLAYPTFCNKYVMAIRGMFVLNQLILLTFFQIGRLHYCFSSGQQQTYGYPKCLFIILYIIGFVLFIMGTYAVFGVEVSKDFYGCINLPYNNKFLASLVYLIYYIWNFTVLGLYWYKLKKITKFIKTNKDQKSGKILKQIYLLLHKILILTIINEIMFFFVSVVTTMLGAYFTGTLYSSIRAISNVIGSVIMYLMIEHNNNDYVMIMSVCFKIFCCCKPMKFDAINTNGQIEENEQGNYVEAGQSSTTSKVTPTYTNNKSHKQKQNTDPAICLQSDGPNEDIQVTVFRDVKDETQTTTENTDNKQVTSIQ